MRKVLLLFHILFFFSVVGQNKDVIGGQCIITGPTNISVGQTVTFSVPNIAQCSSCYDWDIVSGSGSVQIVGSDMNQSVQITRISTGPFELMVTYFTETGCHDCSFIGNSGPTCCVPRYKASLECRPTGGGTGIFQFLDNTTCGLDWSTISSITVTLYGGIIVGVGSNTHTYNNPTGSFGFTFNAPTCLENGYVNVNFIVNYNNGCPPFQKTVRVNAGESTDGKIEIFPNPTNDIVNFKGENLETYNFSLIDINGKLIFNEIRLKDKLDVSHLKSGKYHYIIFKDGIKVDDGNILIK